MQEAHEMQKEQGEGQQSAVVTPSKSSAGTVVTPRPEIHRTLATGAHVGLGHGDVKLAALHRGAALGGLVAGGANAQAAVRSVMNTAARFCGFSGACLQTCACEGLKRVFFAPFGAR